MDKPSDRKIIMELYKKTTAGKIHWYVDKGKKTSITTVWKSSEKLTDTKALSYVIFHRTDEPHKSHLVIYLDKRKRNQHKIYSNLIKVRSIFASSSVMMLLRKGMEKSGDDIKKSVVGIIQKKENPEEILLVKRHPYDKTISNVWVLPGGKVDGQEPLDKAIDREIKEETNLRIKEKSILQYRNIFKLNGQLYSIAPYLITDYSGELHDFPTTELENYTWVNKNDLFNWKIGPETEKIIRFLNKEVLPF